jgi:2-(1,2-epoxy-1,2-dihydrophenyl)acetyl-CoA isomerase
MTDAVDSLSGSVACLVVRGEEEFATGADLRDIYETPRAMRPAKVDGIASSANRYIRAIRALDVPVIAAVEGAAAGGGLGLALACDLIAMSEDAVLDTGFARVGLTPDNATPFFLARTIGPYRARELLLNPRPIPAAEATDLGIANVAYGGEGDDFYAEVAAYAEEMAAYPANIQAHTKELIESAFRADLDEHLEWERSAIKQASDSEAFEEGLASFFEGRDERTSD